MTGHELQLLKEQARTNTYVPHGDVSTAECVIGFAFGMLKAADGTILPGESNRQLAAFIEDNLPDVPLLLQFEIAGALAARSAELVVKEHRVKGEYLHSRELAEQVLVFMQAKGWTSAIVVTHPAMVARNDALCRKLGITTITPPGLEAIEYEPRSAQPWTRDRASWWQREEGAIDICAERDWI